MNVYDHEDAFKDANLCAGRRTKLADALQLATTKELGRMIINDCQNKYLELFEVFIEGVAWAREQENKKKDCPAGTLPKDTR